MRTNLLFPTDFDVLPVASIDAFLARFPSVPAPFNKVAAGADIFPALKARGSKILGGYDCLELGGGTRHWLVEEVGNGVYIFTARTNKANLLAHGQGGYNKPSADLVHVAKGKSILVYRDRTGQSTVSWAAPSESTPYVHAWCRLGYQFDLNPYGVGGRCAMA